VRALSIWPNDPSGSALTGGPHVFHDFRCPRKPKATGRSTSLHAPLPGATSAAEGLDEAGIFGVHHPDNASAAVDALVRATIKMDPGRRALKGGSCSLILSPRSAVFAGSQVDLEDPKWMARTVGSAQPYSW